MPKVQKKNNKPMGSLHNMKQNELSTGELEERLAVIKRFKALLQEQRDKFYEYLLILEKQEIEIRKENLVSMQEYDAIGDAIIKNIIDIQKVIDPIEAIYKETKHEMWNADIGKLQEDLKKLQIAVLRQNKNNCSIIEDRMFAIEDEVLKLKYKNKYSKSIYAKNGDVANYVDVSY